MNLFKYTQIIGAILMFAVLTIAITGLFYFMANGGKLVESKINEKPTPVTSEVTNVSAGEFEEISTHKPIKKITPVIKVKQKSPKVDEIKKSIIKIDTTKQDTLKNI
jgi:hypothetical protein